MRESEIRGFDGKIKQYRHPTQGTPCHTKFEPIRFLVAINTFDIHLGGKTWSIKIIDTIHIVEKMIETKEPKEHMNDKRKIKVTQKLSVLWVQ